MNNKRTEAYSVEIVRNVETGNVERESWTVDGRLNRIGFPAYQEFDPETGVLTVAGYYQFGLPEREDGPFEQHWDPKTGVCILERYCRGGKEHRDNDLPSTIRRDAKSGKVIEENYCQFGVKHRHHGPAKLLYDPDTGYVYYEEWCVRGEKTGTANRPAVVLRNRFSGATVQEEYWKHGLRHRKGQPAYIIRDPETGEVKEKIYFLRGVEQSGPERKPTFSP